jgi:hypothetical protein
MSRELADLTAAPRTFAHAGVEYPVPKLRLRDVGEMQAWLMDHVPSPLAEARRHLDGLPEAVAIHVWDRAAEAARSWPPSPESPEGMARLSQPDGQALLVWIFLRRAIPGLTRDGSDLIAEAMSAADFARLMAAAGPGDPSDPKSPGTPSPSAGAASSPGSPSGTAGRSGKSPR